MTVEIHIIVHEIRCIHVICEHIIVIVIITIDVVTVAVCVTLEIILR